MKESKILIESLLENSYNVIPGKKDQSYIILNLALGSAKRGIDNYESKIGTLTSQNQETMINAGVKYIDGKITEDQYIIQLEKVLSSKAGEKITISSSDRYKIKSRIEGNKNVPNLGGKIKESKMNLLKKIL